MELFILIIVLVILAETTILVSKNSHKIFDNNAKRKIYVDTSALIDGRILSVAQTGFVGDDLIIPRSVIRELQLLADGKDSEKRMRARLGLDTINELERVIYCDVTILQDELDRTPVDERLLSLAKENHGLILTTDFNLIKVAATENIETLNINDLALALETEYLPGEKLKVKITEKCSTRGQGVGHLRDGIMVVVDGASTKIGKDVDAEVIRFLRNSAGRIVFAKIAPKNRSKKPPKA